RVFTAGSSMGGSGSLMLHIRYPERFNWTASWVGVHIPEMSPTFRSSYEQSYGDVSWNILFENGERAFDYFNDALYLRNNPTKEMGFLAFSNGKNDAGIGWAQAVEFYKALRDTKRSFLFKWGQNGHGERSLMPMNLAEDPMPLDFRNDQSLPAFTNGS